MQTALRATFSALPCARRDDGDGVIIVISIIIIISSSSSRTRNSQAERGDYGEAVLYFVIEAVNLGYVHTKCVQDSTCKMR